MTQDHTTSSFARGGRRRSLLRGRGRGRGRDRDLQDGRWGRGRGSGRERDLQDGGRGRCRGDNGDGDNGGRRRGAGSASRGGERPRADAIGVGSLQGLGATAQHAVRAVGIVVPPVQDVEVLATDGVGTCLGAGSQAAGEQLGDDGAVGVGSGLNGGPGDARGQAGAVEAVDDGNINLLRDEALTSTSGVTAHADVSVLAPGRAPRVLDQPVVEAGGGIGAVANEQHFVVDADGGGSDGAVKDTTDVGVEEVVGSDAHGDGLDSNQLLEVGLVLVEVVGMVVHQVGRTVQGSLASGGNASVGGVEGGAQSFAGHDGVKGAVGKAATAGTGTQAVQKLLLGEGSQATSSQCVHGFSGTDGAKDVAITAATLVLDWGDFAGGGPVDSGGRGGGKGGEGVGGGGAGGGGGGGTGGAGGGARGGGGFLQRGPGDVGDSGLRSGL